jgi:hypothetical protein
LDITVGYNGAKKEKIVDEKKKLARKEFKGFI